MSDSFRTFLPLFALPVIALLGACGPAAGEDDVATFESAAVLASSDGRVKVQESPKRTRGGTEVSFPVWLVSVPEVLEATVGGEPSAGLKKGRGARWDWKLDPAEFGRALTGEQLHLVTSFDPNARTVASVDVVPQAKLVRGPVHLRDLRRDSAGTITLMFETFGELGDVGVPSGTAAALEGLPNHFAWTLTGEEFGLLVASAKQAQLKVQVNGRKASVAVALNAAARTPEATYVPADFHAGVVLLAERPERKVDVANADEDALRVLNALARALANDTQLNLNVARLAWVAEDGVVVAYQGVGAIGEGGSTRTESWWLAPRELARKLTRAAGGLDVVIR